ncbi:MAG: transcription antitermination factor NusB [Candidatus Omnitrophica bacterium]|nr:transcription antitermination factor NusB [Candidatus Omnitrophota bacterium]
MRKRTKARELALQLLYQVDIRKEDAGDLLEGFWQDQKDGTKQIEGSVQEYANIIVNGVLDKIGKIDSIITSYAENWELKRMAVIDRNVMRMACFELLFLDDIPPKVSINEAVNLAKKYGDVDSGKFVNGILDKISKKERGSGAGKAS